MSETPLNPIGMEDVPAGGLVPPTYDPLVVEINGILAIAQGWLGREIRVTRPVNALPTASLAVSLASGFLVNFAGDPSAPDLRRLEDFGMLDAALVTVRTAREDPETDYVLFEGYATSLERRADRGGFSMRLECEGVEQDLDLDPRRVFDGSLWRRYLSGAPAVGRVAARSATFNPDGVGNMAKLPPTQDYITWTRLDGEEVSFHRPYFAQSRQRDAVRKWTWAAVLAYWWYWMLRTEDAGSAAQRIDARDIRDETLTVGPSSAPRRVTLLPSLRNAAGDEVDLITYIMTEQLGGGPRLIDFDPDELSLVDESNAFNACLLAAPSSVSIDGMRPLQALDWICARSGLGYVWETVKRDGETVHGLRFFAPRSPTPKRFLLPSPLFGTDYKSWSEVRSQSNVSALRLRHDYRAVVNRTRRVGGPIQYEITVELVPGWAPDPAWDVDPANSADVDGRLAAIGGYEWRQKFVRSGPYFQNYWAVGRLWGLNTHGAWSDYARSGLGNHPFRADRGATPGYAGGLRYPYGEVVSDRRYHDFRWQRWGELYSGSGDHTNPASYRAAGHTFRPRVLRAPVTGFNRATPLPILIEAHYNGGDDSGGHGWRPLAAGVNVSNWDARIYLEAEDLAGEELRDMQGSLLSLAEAYIRGVLRLRVTACVEGDACLESPFIFPLGGGWSAGAPTEGVPHSLSPRPRYGTIVRREASLALREPVDVLSEQGGTVKFSGGNSQFLGSARPTLGRDDRFTEEYATRQSLHGSDRVLHRGVVESPELVFPRGTDDDALAYRPGDMVARIAAPDGAHGGKHDIDLRATLDDDFAVIAAVEWEFRLGGGSDGAPAYCTRYTLDAGRREAGG